MASTCKSSCCFWRVSCCLSSLANIIKPNLGFNWGLNKGWSSTYLWAPPQLPGGQIIHLAPGECHAIHIVALPTSCNPEASSSRGDFLGGACGSCSQGDSHPWEKSVGGIWSPPSTAWSPRRWPQPAGSLGWWPPQWGRSCPRGCRDGNATFFWVNVRLCECAVDNLIALESPDQPGTRESD